MSPLERVCEREGVTVESVYGGAEVPSQAGWVSGTVGWKVTLRYDGRQLTTSYYTGPAIEREPTAADVLYCLISDASVADCPNFESWCADMGYDTDSRKALATFEACKAMAPKLQRFLGARYDAFTCAEH